MKILVTLLTMVMVVCFVMAGITALDQEVTTADNESGGCITNVKIKVRPGLFDGGIQFIDGEWVPILTSDKDSDVQFIVR